MAQSSTRMQARFNSTCKICHRPIHKGDWIHQSKSGAWVHDLHGELPNGLANIIADPAVPEGVVVGVDTGKPFWQHTNAAGGELTLDALMDMDRKIRQKSGHGAFYTDGSPIKWRDVPKIPASLLTEQDKLFKGIQDDMRKAVNRQFLFGPSKPKKKDDVAITAMDYHDVAKEVWDSPSMHEQLYGGNPLLTTKTVTIPLEKKMTEIDYNDPQSLRDKAARLEKEQRKARKAAKKRARLAQERETQRLEARRVLSSIAKDKKARKEDRVEAAWRLLGADY